MSVLQALNGYYDRMAARGEAEEPGYSREKIGFAVVLSPEGRAIAIVDLRELTKKGMRPRLLEVPAAVRRTIAILPNFLWDKTSYALGRTESGGKRTAEEHAAFKELHLRRLAGTEDAGLLALRRFLEAWTPKQFDDAPFVENMLDSNIVFRLDGEQRYIHEREGAKALMAQSDDSDAPRAFCLVTGKDAPIRRLHPTIKGVDGAQSSGAALVSFNLDAFTSYGKEQGASAPTSETAASRYGAALNRLLDYGSRNRVKVADTTVVFWADASALEEAAVTAAERDFADWLGVPSPSADAKLEGDAVEAARIRDSLEAVAGGRPSKDVAPEIAQSIRFHILGLAPNAARISIRFWLENSIGDFARRLKMHFDDLAIEPAPWRAKLPSVQRLLAKTTALQEKFDNIPPLLAGETMRAVLGGGRYPETLLRTAMVRLRAGDDPGTGWHAAVAKACLNRAHRLSHPRAKEPISVSLDPNNENPAYQLGRLFAVLESAQIVALGRKLNAPISDRYYGAASATPARVFGSLMRGARVHLSDARKRGKGGWIESRLNEIVSRLPPTLPTSLPVEGQATFAIGYYHQRSERFARDGREAEEGEATEETEERS